MRRYQLKFELLGVDKKNKDEPMNKKMFEIIILAAASVKNKVHEIVFEGIL